MAAVYYHKWWNLFLAFPIHPLFTERYKEQKFFSQLEG